MAFGGGFRSARAAFLALVLGLALAAQARAAGGVGMVTRTTGEVRVLPAAGGAARKADLLVELEPGDRLVVPAGGGASVVLYLDGHGETVQAGTYRVTPRGLEGPKVTRSAASRALAGLQTGTALGGARGATTTRAPEGSRTFVEFRLAPAARVERARPSIGLPPDPGGGKVRTVALLDAQNQVVESKVLADERSFIPQKPLPPGEYQVVLLEEGGAVQSRQPLVVVQETPELSARLDELERLGDLGDPAPWVLASVLLEREGLLEAALEAAWQAQARQASPAMLRWAADLALRLGRSTEAEALLRLAAQLQPAAP